MGVERHDGWTQARRLRFLHALAHAPCVAKAAAAVGMNKRSAYRLRARDFGFAADWDVALAPCADALAADMIAAARRAEKTPRWKCAALLRAARTLDEAGAHRLNQLLGSAAV